MAAQLHVSLGVRLSYPDTWRSTAAVALQKWWSWDKIRLSWQVGLWLSLPACCKGMRLKLVLAALLGIRCLLTSLDGVGD